METVLLLTITLYMHGVLCVGQILMRVVKGEVNFGQRGRERKKNSQGSNEQWPICIYADAYEIAYSQFLFRHPTGHQLYQPYCCHL